MSAPEPSWSATLTPAIFGLIGVLLGSGLATLKEWWFSRRIDKRDARYLAVLVVGQLDRYVFACSEVVTDDGLCQGQRDEQGYRRSQVKPPRFNPEALTVEWRSIPADLMYDILDLPYKAEVAGHIIEGASENADPPDFEDYFEERQLQYANLGLQAAAIAARLRSAAKLPERSVAHWDPIAWMSEYKAKIEAARTERAKNWEQQIAGRGDA
ncbi:MAG: hypothetical protein IPG91_19455 [Ideonella sp.]|nr:hypothetical protein [Ideonella sp.]